MARGTASWSTQTIMPVPPSYRRCARNRRGSGSARYSLGNPVCSRNHGQCPERVQWDGVPTLEACLIGGDSSQHRQASQQMSVPRERVIPNPSTDFEEQHRKSNRRQWLPEFWHLVVDEQRDAEPCRPRQSIPRNVR